MEDALDEVCERLGEERLDPLERELYLQTSDEHWRDHIGNMQELMLSVSFTGHGIKHATAEYTFQSYEAYQRLKRNAADDFVHKLFRFPIEDLVQPMGTTRVLEDEVAGILA